MNERSPPGWRSDASRDYLSYSSLRTFRQCPLRYFFRYVQGLPEERVSVGLAFGGAIHAALERHFRALASDGAAPVADLMEAYRWAWSERAVRLAPEDAAESLAHEALAARMLAAFQASPAARPTGRIVGVERELRGQIVEGLPELLGRIDLLVEAGDELLVTDFKTARGRWNADAVAEASEQLILYGELVRRQFPDKPVRLQFVVLTKTKSPTIEVHDVSFNHRQSVRALRAVQGVHAAIAAGRFYPNPSPMNCATCPFRAPCRRWPD